MRLVQPTSFLFYYSLYMLYHSDALFFNSAINCFTYILILRNIRRIYVPYYLCAAIFHIIEELSVEKVYYHIDSSFEPTTRPKLDEDEAFYYVNYWGLKQRCVVQLFNHYGSQLIVDNAQAFFSKPIGADTFYSAHKFYGVNNGAFLYLSKSQNDISLTKNTAFGETANCLTPCVVNTYNLLRRIDYSRAIFRRHENYRLLDNALKDINTLRLSLDDDSVPMVYPFWPEDANLTKSRLHQKGFPIEQFWPIVLELTHSNDIEYKITQNMIPLFIGQNAPRNYIRDLVAIIRGS